MASDIPKPLPGVLPRVWKLFPVQDDCLSEAHSLLSIRAALITTLRMVGATHWAVPGPADVDTLSRCLRVWA